MSGSRSGMDATEMAWMGWLLAGVVVAGVGVWSFQRALEAWRGMMAPLAERVELLEVRALEQAQVISQQAEQIRVLEYNNRRLEQELDESRRRVTALVMQLRDKGLVPNFDYYERGRDRRKGEEDGTVDA